MAVSNALGSTPTVGRRRGLLRVGVLVFAVLSMLFTLPGAAQQYGGGDGSGSGGDGGGGGDDGATGSEFSDLVIILREESGEPIFAEFDVVGETGTTTEYCVQPISYDPLPGMTEGLEPAGDGVENPVDGRTVYPIPLMGDAEVQLLAEEEVEVCDPDLAYAMYVSEAELERLNMARTSEDVVDQKLADVVERLIVAEELSLDGAARLVIDGAVVDAGPEHAALFQELMKTGTLPSLPEGYTNDGDDPDHMFVSPFGAEELAAASIGAAASKFARLSIDAVIYYMGNVTKMTTLATGEDALFGQLPAMTGKTTDRFFDFSTFSYNRAQTFNGAVTWLDVPTLSWRTSRILDVVDWAPIPPIADPSSTPSPYAGAELHNLDVPGIAGFALLVDDVRATILYYHEYEALVGFYMDSPGEDTYADQLAALSAPATQWGPMPAKVVQTEMVSTTAAVFYPHAATETIEGAQLQVTVSLKDDLATPETEKLDAADAGLIVAGTTGEEAIDFVFDEVTATLTGHWRGPFDLVPGYRDDPPIPFELAVGEGATTGTYEFGLELVGYEDGTGPVEVLDTAVMEVLPPYMTAGWVSLTRYVEQETHATLVTRVFNPDIGDVASEPQEMLLTIVPRDGAVLAQTDATLYSEATKIDLEPMGTALQGTLPIPILDPGQAVEIEAYLTIHDAAPLGWYDLTIEVVGSAAAADAAEMYVADAVVHTPTDPGNGGGGEGDGEEPPPTEPPVIVPPGTDPGDGGGGETPVGAAMTELAGADRVATAIEVSKAQFPGKASAAVLADAGVFADALAGTPLAVAMDAPMLLTETGELDSRVALELDRVLEPRATVYLLGGTAALSESVESALSQMGYQPVRFAGVDRYETSVKIAEGLGNPATVFLTTGHDFADGLTAGTAAATVDGAVLLTDGDAMAAPVVAHLAAHPSQTRYAVGGPATRADTGAVAIAGADRFATAAMVAETFFSAPVFVGIASGEKFPDALSGGVASAMNGGPLMLSASSVLSTATAGFLTDHVMTIEEVQFYGGTAALSQAVRDGVANSLS